MDINDVVDTGTIQTIGKISPPVLLILAINAVALALHKIVPRKFELILCVVAGMILYPTLIDPTSLIYAFPRPMAALVVYGILAGFVAKMIQPRIKAGIKRVFKIELNGHNDDTQFITRLPVCPLEACPLKKEVPGYPCRSNHSRG